MKAYLCAFFLLYISSAFPSYSEAAPVSRPTLQYDKDAIHMYLNKKTRLCPFIGVAPTPSNAVELVAFDVPSMRFNRPIFSCTHSSPEKYLKDPKDINGTLQYFFQYSSNMLFNVSGQIHLQLCEDRDFAKLTIGSIEEPNIHWKILNSSSTNTSIFRLREIDGMVLKNNTDMIFNINSPYITVSNLQVYESLVHRLETSFPMFKDIALYKNHDMVWKDFWNGERCLSIKNNELLAHSFEIVSFNLTNGINFHVQLKHLLLITALESEKFICSLVKYDPNLQGTVLGQPAFLEKEFLLNRGTFALSYRPVKSTCTAVKERIEDPFINRYYGFLFTILMLIGAMTICLCYRHMKGYPPCVS